MNRRQFLRNTSLITSTLAFGSAAWAAESEFPVVRTPEDRRRFKSPAVERTIDVIKTRIRNKELAWMFENCFPNTLDTTVEFEVVDDRPDTYVITGDIDAMWLRDSTAQVWPYLPLMKSDTKLQQLIAGVINRHTRCIRKDPYANAFYKNETRESHWKSDHTEMRPGVHERKWEVDSLCYPIRLAYHYWKMTGDPAPFDDAWRDAVLATLRTFREQQRKTGKGPYRFQRRTEVQTDTVALGGYGNPCKPVGLIYSIFRPSDDATIFPFLVPSNFFAVVSLRQAAEMLATIKHDPQNANQCRGLADEVERALQEYAIVHHPQAGRVYAYEVDAFGNYYCIDDGNVPSLLSLPYIGAVKPNDRLYKSTRRLVLSALNPYYCKGKAADGPGGPHVGMNMIWPLGIIVQGLTSTDDQEIIFCLDTLCRTHAGTGFMHEAFNKDDPKKFTRSWFAWANTIFGELVLKTANERPQLLRG